MPPVPRRASNGRVAGQSCRILPLLAALLGLALPLCAVPSGALADAWGEEVVVLTNHVQTNRDAPPANYPRRLDSNGQHVFTPGLSLYYDQSLSGTLAGFPEIRYEFGLLRDSVDHLFGYLGVMGRQVLYQSSTFAVAFHVGPGLIFRKSWRGIEGYEPDNPLDESDHFMPGYEYKLMPVGEFDLLWQWSENTQITWSIVPGIPYVIVHSLGLRHQL